MVLKSELHNQEVYCENMIIKIQPIQTWTGKQTKVQKQSQFRKTYADTKKILEHELDKLSVEFSTIVLSLFVDSKDIRLDGELRASTKPFKSGVILSFARKIKRYEDGKLVWQLQQLRYPCDTFTDWKDNLRGIALSLQNLRAVERYGVFSYEELVDRLSLPSAGDEISTRKSALEFIAQVAKLSVFEVENDFKKASRIALFATHPDQNKSKTTDDFLKLQKAFEVLNNS